MTDCYVAVTGVPNPQDNHAVIMVRFVRDCMVKMPIILGELSEKLGADTASLEMRVGLHSGAVTGGVLRGQKGRFQLFGDAMNTASRMESNGVGGRIHCSDSTASELISKGKADWVTAREDKLLVKGKGEMQTYWIRAHGGTTEVLSSTGSSNNPCGTLQNDTFGYARSANVSSFSSHFPHSAQQSNIDHDGNELASRIFEA